MTHLSTHNIHIKTCTISQMRNLKQQGYVPIDITVKSSSGFWKDAAPTWDMVMGYKRGTLTVEEYTKLYRPIMKSFFSRHGRALLEFFRDNKFIAFACYCKEGDFCHRELFANEIYKFILVYANRIK